MVAPSRLKGDVSDAMERRSRPSRSPVGTQPGPEHGGDHPYGERTWRLSPASATASACKGTGGAARPCGTMRTSELPTTSAITIHGRLSSRPLWLAGAFWCDADIDCHRAASRIVRLRANAYPGSARARQESHPWRSVPKSYRQAHHGLALGDHRLSILVPVGVLP